MPPRNQHSAVSFDSFPDEIVIKCLEGLDLKERHSVAALVCKRWRLLSTCPQLLDTLEFVVMEEGEAMMNEVEAIAGWLTRHAAGRIRRLRVMVDGGPPIDEEARDWPYRAAKALLRMLPGINSNHQLQDVCITCAGATFYLPYTNKWTRVLGCSLRRLRLSAGGDGGMEIGDGLQAMTALQELQLQGCYVDVTEGCHLPPSLIRLAMDGGLMGDKLPTQIWALTALQSLALTFADYKPEGYGLLSDLPALTSLELERCRHLPACLPQMTGLVRLRIDHFMRSKDVQIAAERAEQLRQGLLALTQLTELVLLGVPPVSPALGALSCLVKLAWEMSSKGPPQALLPGGAWLGNAQELALPASHLLSSMAVLDGARQLSALRISSLFDMHVDEQKAVLSWAADERHLPHLCHLTLDMNGAHCCEASFRAVVAALQRRPSLSIHFLPENQSVFKGLWPVEQAFPLWRLPPAEE